MDSLDEELLLRIALDPGDVTLKHAFADGLTARGHLWGELIGLQLLAKPTPPQRARARALLSIAESWLPDVMRHVLVAGSTRWAQGFLVGAAIAHGDVARAAYHPLWGTVHRLHRAPIELARACPHLSTWSGLSNERLATAAQEPMPGSVVAVGLDTEAEPPELAQRWLDAALERGPLRELWLGPDGGWAPSQPWGTGPYLDVDDWELGPWHPGHPRRIGWVSGLRPKLERLRLHLGVVALGRWLETLDDVRLQVSTLAFRSNTPMEHDTGWELELTLTSPGRWRHAAVRTWSFGRGDGEPLEVEGLEAMLRTVPPRYFSRLELHGDGWRNFRRLECFKAAEVVRR